MTNHPETNAQVQLDCQDPAAIGQQAADVILGMLRLTVKISVDWDAAGTEKQTSKPTGEYRYFWAFILIFRSNSFHWRIGLIQILGILPREQALEDEGLGACLLKVLAKLQTESLLNARDP